TGRPETRHDGGHSPRLGRHRGDRLEDRSQRERDQRALRQQEDRETRAGGPRIGRRAYGGILRRLESQGHALFQTEELTNSLRFSPYSRLSISACRLASMMFSWTPIVVHVE